jgi:hypothetical protein
VPGEPTQACGRTAKDPQRQAPGPLPILRTTVELQEHLAVLSDDPAHLEEVAHSPHSWKAADVGKTCGNPSSPPLVASTDHTPLG